jgi:uncharacterized damage-inducible protein DinB
VHANPTDPLFLAFIRQVLHNEGVGLQEMPMDAALKHWVNLWDYLDGNFWGIWRWAADHLAPDAVGWQPVPQVASIGWNLQHLGEMLDLYLSRSFLVNSQVQQSPLLTMQSGSMDDGRYRDLEAIAAYHRQVRPLYRAFLVQLTLAELDRPLGGRQPRTWGWAIGHIAEHESYHVGKCTLLRTLLRHRTRNE